MILKLIRHYNNAVYYIASIIMTNALPESRVRGDSVLCCFVIFATHSVL